MKILLLNQAFHPDIAATSQQAADLARALAAEGHQLTVVCSRRAYDDPAVTYPRRENWQGVEIRRIWNSGFGKGAKWRRALDFATFLISCCIRLSILGRFDRIVALTSPPLISFVALLFARLTASQLVLWLMDLNPDEAVAAGWLKQRSLAERFLSWCLRCSLRGAARIVVLDRFMRDRIIAKGIEPELLSVIPPWIQSDAVQSDPEGARAFRERHGLADKFVVMYSGNHSPCHPLDSLLEAAAGLSSDPGIAFCFVGGGSEFQKVRKFARARELHNVVCLPYQPFNEISASLSAADLHAVVMGDPFVGIVHPCKIYNVMELGIPVLYIGPPESHISDLGPENWLLAHRHGEAAAIRESILRAKQAGTQLQEGERLRAQAFAQTILVRVLSAAVLNAGGAHVYPAPFRQADINA